MMDDNLRARHDELLANVQRLKSDCDAHFYVIGTNLSEFSRGGLFKLDKYDDFKTWLSEVADLPESQAYKWIAVAENFREADAVRFQVEKCAAILRLVRATPEDDRPADFLRLGVPVLQADGRVVVTPVESCTVDQIDAATARVRGAGARALTPAEEATVEGLRTAAPEGVKVAASPGRTRAMLTLIFPLAQACEVLPLLTAACAADSRRREIPALVSKGLHAAPKKKGRSKRGN